MNTPPPAAMEVAARAIEFAKAARRISDHGYGEPIPGKICEYRTDTPVTNVFFNPAEVATALLYLICGPVQVLRSVPRKYAGTSYGWKHQAENWGELVGLSPYISNGAFIVAADWLWVPSRRYPNSPNIAYGLKATRESHEKDSLFLAFSTRK